MTGAVSPIHLLLVDDLPENLLALEAIMRREDIVILKAKSGEEALELLLQHEVALALLDVQMPGMDGFELAEFMRGSERTRHIPIIFLTAGLADHARKFRGYEAGAVDFLQKPIDADILRSKANVFFDLFQQRRIITEQRDALKIAGEELALADRRKDEFIAVLVHELRNPIASLLAGLHLMQRQQLNEKAEDIRGQMERQLFHMNRLVDDLLDIARITKGKISLQRTAVSLQTVVQTAIETSEPIVTGRNHDLVLDIPDATIPMVVDHTRTAQIISNLVSNAAKYTPPGGIVSVRAMADDTAVTIEVADNGIGIPEEMLDRIFDLFTQVEEHRTMSGGGLGIGLALVHRLVKLHGGSIEAQSDGPDKGSLFRVRLPLGSSSDMG